jgi:hypothetical protein
MGLFLLKETELVTIQRFFRKVLDCAVISTNGRNLKRWPMNRGLRFLAALGMTKDAE